MIQKIVMRFKQKNRHYIAIAILTIGLISSGLLAYKVRHEEDKRIQLTLELRSLLISTTLQRSIRSNFDILTSVYSFYALSSPFTERTFQQFFATEFQDQSVIKSLRWVPRVTTEQRQQFESQNRNQLTTIREIGEQGLLQTAGRREEYFPVLYTTQQETTAESLLGVDLATSSTLQNAMTEARDSGQVVATLAVDSKAHEELEQLRLLVFVPIYDSPSNTDTDPARVPETVEVRRQKLSGFFVGELLIFNLVRGSFDELNMGGIDVFVTEELDQNQLLYVHKKRNGEYVQGSLQELDQTLATQDVVTNTALDVSGENWTLFFVPNARFFESERTAQWQFVLIAGSISSVLLSLYLKRQGDYAESTRALLSQLEDKNQSLETALIDLQTAQTQAIQTEKLSALGRMVGGIAHEINNPVNFISGNLKHVQDECMDLLQMVRHYQDLAPHAAATLPESLQDIDISFIEKDLPKAIQSMAMGAHRIRDIVLALRTFARVDESARKTVDLHTGLDSTLVILEHRLNVQRQRPAIQVTKIYGELPKIDCLPGQINQVFMHLLNNAIDALEEAWEKGKWPQAPENSASTHDVPKLWIYTEALPVGSVTIRIVDNGLGIPTEILPKLFDPFFSTKPVGKGTGLGLSISHQVIQRHGGTLTCQSYPEDKTEFLITLPLKMPG